MRRIVRLASTGDHVNIATSEGANAFLDQPVGPNGFNFFSTELKTADSIRKRERKKGKLNNSERLTLRQIYENVCIVICKGELKLFRTKVSKRDLEAWLNHALEVLRALINDHKWINTGNLLAHDTGLIVTLCELFKHPTAVALVFDEIRVLETISDMMSALEKPPSIEPANYIVVMVEMVYGCCRCSLDKKWKPEKALKKLESTGLLQHHLRCLAIDDSPIRTHNNLTPSLRELLACPAFVHKHFKEGTPCGDTVRGILNGTEAYKYSSRILPCMKSLIQLSQGVVRAYDYVAQNQRCHNCFVHSSEADLKECAKCKAASYCSRECQKTDWKEHKKNCKVPMPRRKGKKDISALMHIVLDFVFNDYVTIMIRMVQECQKSGGLQFDEMVLELDLTPDPNGRIPFLQDPPEFNIVSIAKYLDGSWLEDPDSVFAGRSSEYSSEAISAVFKDKQSRKKPTELFVFASHVNSCTIQFCGKETVKGSGKHIYSQEAVDAFYRLLTKKDFSLLWKIFTCETRRRSIISGLGLDDEELSKFHFPKEGDDQLKSSTLEEDLKGTLYAKEKENQYKKSNEQRPLKA